MDKTQIRDALKRVMYFNSDDLFNDTLEVLARGESVILLTHLYMGNNRWKLDKFRYKMIVPTFDKKDRIYSTDVFDTVYRASSATYEIYYATQQLAMKIEKVLPFDGAEERYGNGYTEEEYGRRPLVAPHQ